MMPSVCSACTFNATPAHLVLLVLFPTQVTRASQPRPWCLSGVGLCRHQPASPRFGHQMVAVDNKVRTFIAGGHVCTTDTQLFAAAPSTAARLSSLFDLTIVC